MRRLVFGFIVASFVVSALASAETWNSLPLVDKMCVEKVKSDPDKHETRCLINCAKSGYGVLMSDGTWVAFDSKGNQEALEALKATKKTEGIRVTVTGERKGDTIQVSTLTID